MSENQYPPTKPVCQLDTDNLYLHQTEADLDPLAEDGSYLLPAGCIDAEPPEARAGFAARWLRTTSSKSLKSSLIYLHDFAVEPTE